jgi:hypothetical protein
LVVSIPGGTQPGSTVIGSPVPSARHARRAQAIAGSLLRGDRDDTGR